MGGSGRLSDREIASLENIAREKLTQSASDGARHVFISFANEDKKEVDLLRGQAKNEDNSLEFDDLSLKAPIDSKVADYVKRPFWVITPFMLILFCLQFISMGLLAELQTRTYHESQGKPIYVIKERVDSQA